MDSHILDMLYEYYARLEHSTQDNDTKMDLQIVCGVLYALRNTDKSIQICDSANNIVDDAIKAINVAIMR